MTLEHHPEGHAPSGADQSECVDARQAYALMQQGAALLVDVRTAEERKSIGYVPSSIHVAWRLGPASLKNPRFLKELSQHAGPDDHVIFICRSEIRSAEAVEAATKAGYRASYVADGVDEVSGWRGRGLPWSA